MAAILRHEFKDDGPDYSWLLAGGRNDSRWRDSDADNWIDLALGATFAETDRFTARVEAGTSVSRDGYDSFHGNLKLEWRY